MTGIKRRSLRLELMAGLGMALAMVGLPAGSANAQSVSTQTVLTVATHEQSGQTQAKFHVAVTGFDGQPASGAVVLEDGRQQLAGVTLDSNGQATATLPLASGAHALRAVYVGDATYQRSASLLSNVQTQTPAGAPNFQIAVSPASASVTAGESATITVSVTPVNNASLTSPMFVTLSCSNLPNQAACSFNPSTIQILSTTTGALTSQMVLQTQAATTSAKVAAPAAPGHHGSPVAWAVLLPGVLGLGGLAWGARRRRWLQRLALVALVALVTSLGATGCNPLYYYKNHGPPPAPATPSGSYTIAVTGQTSNGVTATTNSTSVALTVK